MKSLIIVLALAFAGCASRHHSSSPWTVSPQGYRVLFEDQGTVSTDRAALPQIYEWHSKAVERAVSEVALKHSRPRPDILALARGKAWNLVDNCAFQVSGAAWAAGRYFPQSNTIKTCLYAWKDGTKAQIPAAAPLWTIRQDPNGTDHWRWGALVDGQWFPSAAHEIEEVLGVAQH